MNGEKSGHLIEKDELFSFDSVMTLYRNMNSDR